MSDSGSLKTWIEAQVSTGIMSPMGSAIFLIPTNQTEDQEDQLVLPMVIGLSEAQAIVAYVMNRNFFRPLTCDLVLKAAEQFGATLHSVFITELKDETYYAELTWQKGGESIKMDCRPSDAIALALRCGLPIFVNKELFRPTQEVFNQDESDEEGGVNPVMTERFNADSILGEAAEDLGWNESPGSEN